MTRLLCPVCERPVARDATHCPYCDEPLPPPQCNPTRTSVPTRWSMRCRLVTHVGHWLASLATGTVLLLIAPALRADVLRIARVHGFGLMVGLVAAAGLCRSASPDAVVSTVFRVRVVAALRRLVPGLVATTLLLVLSEVLRKA